MGVGALFLLALSVGMSIWAASLRSKPKEKGFVRDNKPTTLADRGSYVPLTIGRRRGGYVFGWAGNREIKKEVTGETGGKGGGGSKKTYAQIYHEDAWHLITIGPGFRLHGIKQNGVEILNQVLQRDTHPSGTSINLGKEGTIRIFWGEHDQPRNNMFGVNSRWPHMMYVQWIAKRLGQSPQWASLDYDYEVLPSTESEVFSEFYINNGANVSLYDKDGVQKWTTPTLGTSNLQRLLIAPDGSKDAILLQRDFGQTHNFVRLRYSDGAILWNIGYSSGILGGDACSGGDFSPDGTHVWQGSHSGSRNMEVNIATGAIRGDFRDYSSFASPNNQQNLLTVKADAVGRFVGDELQTTNFGVAAVLPLQPRALKSNVVLRVGGMGTQEGVFVFDDDPINDVPTVLLTNLPTIGCFIKGDLFDLNWDPGNGIGTAEGAIHIPEMDMLLVGTDKGEDGPAPMPASNLANLHGYRYSTGEVLWRADVGSSINTQCRDMVAFDVNSDHPKLLLNANGVPRVHSLKPGQEGAFLGFPVQIDPSVGLWYQGGYDGRDISVNYTALHSWNQDNLWERTRYVDTPTADTWAPLPVNANEIDPLCLLGGGLEPSCVIKQLLTGTFPHGCGIPPQFINSVSLNEMQQLMVAEDLGISVIAADGDTGAQALADIHQDIGAMIHEDGNALKFRTIRAQAEGVPFLTDEFILGPEPKLEFQHGPKVSDRLVFIYNDQDRNFRDIDIQADNDSFISEHGRPKTKKVSMTTIVDHTTAAKVAVRRRQEELAGTVGYDITATRDAGDLRPGQIFNVSNIGSLVLVSMQYETADRKVKLEAVMNYYGQAIPDFDPSQGVDSPETKDVAVDNPFFMFETPYSFDFGSGNSGQLALSFVRNRAHNEILGADVWISANDISYDLNSPQNAYAPGGELDEAFDTTEEAPCGVIESGPLFTTDDINGITQVEDLRGNEQGWRSGLQVALIIEMAAGEPTGVYEAFFLRNIVAAGGIQYRLEGLIGCRGETKPFAHTAGARVMIFNPTEIRQQLHQYLTLDQLIYGKTQPRTSVKVQSLADVVSQSVLMKGNALRPLPLDNFIGNMEAIGTNNEYGTGDDVVFRWDYRIKPGTGLGAGELNAGVPIGEGPPAPEGTFTIDVYTTGDVFVAEIAAGLTTPTFTYDNADIITDHGGEIDFKARVRHIIEGYSSDEEEITITKV